MGSERPKAQDEIDAERRIVLRQSAGTVWLTGLPCAGKSTLAFGLERRWLASGRAGFVLDGDKVRHGLGRDLGYSSEHRRENVRRVAEVAKLMNDAGLVVIAALISPLREHRELARQIVGHERYAEVFVDAPLAVCESRDIKGMFRLARDGRLAEFTGVSAPYEPPANPELRLHTGVDSVERCLEQLYGYVDARFGVV